MAAHCARTGKENITNELNPHHVSVILRWPFHPLSSEVFVVSARFFRDPLIHSKRHMKSSWPLPEPLLVSQVR